MNLYVYDYFTYLFTICLCFVCNLHMYRKRCNKMFFTQIPKKNHVWFPKEQHFVKLLEVFHETIQLKSGSSMAS